MAKLRLVLVTSVTFLFYIKVMASFINVRELGHTVKHKNMHEFVASKSVI